MHIYEHIKVVNKGLEPVINNNGYSLDIRSPYSFTMPPGGYTRFNSGFILTLPEPYQGILTTKAYSPFQLLITSGSIIYPLYTKELSIEIQNTSQDSAYIPAGAHILQLYLTTGIKLDE